MQAVSSRGYDQLLELMLSSFGEIGSAVLATHARELNAAMVNDMFDLPGPRRIERVADENELIWREVWCSFIEIQGSYDALLDFEVYIRRYPYARTRISKVRHLLHTIEAYLHDAYVLTERLKTFPGLVSKHLTDATKKQSIDELAKRLSKAVNKSFKNVTSIRGRHTHNERFDSDEFMRLRLLEGFLGADRQLSWAEDARLMFDSSYRKIRNRWAKTISENNAKTREFLDQYCDALRPFIFHDGKFLLTVKMGIGA